MTSSRVKLAMWLIARMVVRLVLAAVVLLLALALPAPLHIPHWFDMVYVPVAVASFIIYIGKLLIDTFFYPHYK